MSDAIPLPPRPNVEQYKKLARDLQRACKAGEDSAIRDWAARWAERLHAAGLTPQATRLLGGIPQRWPRFQRQNDDAASCKLSAAQFFIARAHGFLSWPAFAQHLELLEGPDSEISRFEQAVDAIVAGDGATLRSLLSEHPELVRMRSTREHRSTLLHYVSANGVEDFRQKTPPNIVEIAALLLDTGADVNAESDAYGEGYTTLGLTATSCHPDAAGVQIALLELLLDRGARIDGPDSGSGVNACLHNGRGRAAEFFADRGARLDLEGAAGVGRLDVVKSFVGDDGKVKPPATHKQLIDGFNWACEFGRYAVVEFLLQKSIDAAAKLRGGETGLHWAAYEAHTDIVELLLSRGAPVNAVDDTHHGTPLEWAIYAWRQKDDPGYYKAVAILTNAGAKLDPNWFEDDEDRKRAAAKLRRDPRMQAALRGEIAL
jgi:ankyrin repeat protein